MVAVALSGCWIYGILENKSSWLLLYVVLRMIEMCLLICAWIIVVVLLLLSPTDDTNVGQYIRQNFDYLLFAAYLFGPITGKYTAYVQKLINDSSTLHLHFDDNLHFDNNLHFDDNLHFKLCYSNQYNSLHFFTYFLSFSALEWHYTSVAYSLYKNIKTEEEQNLCDPSVLYTPPTPITEQLYPVVKV